MLTAGFLLVLEEGVTWEKASETFEFDKNSLRFFLKLLFPF